MRYSPVVSLLALQLAVQTVAFLHVDLIISRVEAVVLSLKSPVMTLAFTLDQRAQKTSLNWERLVVSAHHCSIKLIAFIIDSKLLAKVHENALHSYISMVTKSKKNFNTKTC